MKPVKLISLAVVAVLVIGLVAGVAYWSVGYDPDYVEPGLYVDGNKVEDPGVIMTVGGHDVDFTLYRYFYKTTEYSYLYYDENYFDHDPDNSLREGLLETVEDNLKQWFSWLDIAEDMGIALDADDMQEIEDALAQEKEDYGDQFEARLEGLYLTDEANYRHILESQTLISKAQEALNEEMEEAYSDDALAEVVTARHILITPDGYAENAEEYDNLMAGGLTDTTGGDADEGTDADGQDAEPNADDDTAADETVAADDATVDADEGTEPADDAADADAAADAAEDAEARDDDAGAKAFAEWLVGQINASDDLVETFDELRLEYDEDPGQTAEDYTAYTFGQGSMVDEFYEGAMALAENTISAPIASDYGYHIILRLPLDEDYVDENYDSLVSTFVSAKVEERYNEFYEGMAVEYGANYIYIDPDNVF